MKCIKVTITSSRQQKLISGSGRIVFFKFGIAHRPRPAERRGRMEGEAERAPLRPDHHHDDVIRARSADSSAHWSPHARDPAIVMSSSIPWIYRSWVFSPSLRAAPLGLHEDKPRDCGADGCGCRDCIKLPSASQPRPLRSDNRQNRNTRERALLYSNIQNGLSIILTWIYTPGVVDSQSWSSPIFCALLGL